MAIERDSRGRLKKGSTLNPNGFASTSKRLWTEFTREVEGKLDEYLDVFRKGYPLKGQASPNREQRLDSDRVFNVFCKFAPKEPVETENEEFSIEAYREALETIVKLSDELIQLKEELADKFVEQQQEKNKSVTLKVPVTNKGKAGKKKKPKEKKQHTD